jgi:predicted ATPase/class 3 adenylate cyclase
MKSTAPSGVVTFLFTDIEGSTRRWEADAEAMRAALAAHDRVLRDVIASHEGWVFKHTGDGVCAAFASPKAAVDAAIEAQCCLALPVRMGIATGEAELRGDDYFGAVLNRAARVMAAGHGGQILLDGATAGLLSGVDLLYLGPQRLRDITKHVVIHQVRAEGIRTEFPPLRTVESMIGNLKVPATSFVGRESELFELQTALKSHRLLTLIGVGGVGKTRLALELASMSAGDFSDGVWAIELAAVTDPAAVPEAIAAVLGIVQQPGITLAASVAQAMEGRARLLVFDNCEHLLDAAADMIEAILDASSTVKIVATSREGLRLAEEQLWPVPTLDVHSSAATLFVERSSAVAPAVALEGEAQTVTEICRRLDGIPLAIELAASRMQSMSATEVRDHLDDRFRLLVGSRRGLERHQTLRAAVRWSYDLLDEDEKAMLDRCSVFVGGFDLAGAAAVTDTDDGLATLDVLDALVRKSLLVADRSSGRTRYSMLETIREFAEGQLAQDAEETRQAHARYFAGREADLLALWDGPRQREAYAWFGLELANLRAAFRWAVDNDDLDCAATIAVYASFLGVITEIREPLTWAETLIPLARDVDHPRLAQLFVLATWCYTAGRIDDATEYARAARDALDNGRYAPVPFDLECAIGSFYAAQGQPELWVELCRNAIERDDAPHVYARSALVSAFAISNRIDEAIEESKDLPAAAEAEGNPQHMSFALFAYGIARRYSDLPAAYAALSRGLEIAQKSGNRQNESFTALSLAWLAVRRQRPAEALNHLAVATRIRYDSGSFSLMDSPLAVLAMLLDQLEIFEPAARVITRAATRMSSRVYPELADTITHLRHVLGDDGLDELSRAGEQMSDAAMAAYALQQIESARAAHDLA